MSPPPLAARAPEGKSMCVCVCVCVAVNVIWPNAGLKGRRCVAHEEMKRRARLPGGGGRGGMHSRLGSGVLTRLPGRGGGHGRLGVGSSPVRWSPSGASPGPRFAPVPSAPAPQAGGSARRRSTDDGVRATVTPKQQLPSSQGELPVGSGRRWPHLHRPLSDLGGGL